MVTTTSVLFESKSLKAPEEFETKPLRQTCARSAHALILINSGDLHENNTIATGRRVDDR